MGKLVISIINVLVSEKQVEIVGLEKDLKFEEWLKILWIIRMEGGKGERVQVESPKLHGVGLPYLYEPGIPGSSDIRKKRAPDSLSKEEDVNVVDNKIKINDSFCKKRAVCSFLCY